MMIGFSLFRDTIRKSLGKDGNGLGLLAVTKKLWALIF